MSFSKKTFLLETMKSFQLTYKKSKKVAEIFFGPVSLFILQKLRGQQAV